MAEHPQQRYRVIEKLASGGMAEVFRAESAGVEGFKKQVAIKRVLPHLSEKKKFISMFLDEARLSAHLSHSNVAQVFDIGVGDNAFFIVMEYVDGADLKAVIETLRNAGREFPLEEACFIALKICEGLAYAHELVDPKGRPLNVVHRDVSPPNVLITKYGEVKIVDFGLAKASSQLEKSEPGIIKGKFSYLSPEAAQGLEVDHRTDIFAVGIILWEMLAGRRLFLGESDYATVKQVQQAKVPPITQFNRRVPPELESILARALARDPNERYQTARELGLALNHFLYRHGKSVGSFDIASLVSSVVEKKQAAKTQSSGSIISKLIEEALFEFTSLQAADDAAAVVNRIGNKKPAAGSLGIEQFQSIRDWASEIEPGPASPRVADTFTPKLVEAGNLAALEEDFPASGTSLSSYPPPALSSLPPPSASERGGRAAADSVPPPKASSTKVYALAVLLALAVAAAAWQAGLIPGLTPAH